jgi:hypothetical protein
MEAALVSKADTPVIEIMTIGGGKWRLATIIGGTRFVSERTFPDQVAALDARALILAARDGHLGFRRPDTSSPNRRRTGKCAG